MIEQAVIDCGRRLSTRSIALKGRKKDGQKLKPDPARDAEIIRLRKEGMYPVAIAEKLGVLPSLTRHVLQKNGLGMTKAEMASPPYLEYLVERRAKNRSAEMIEQEAQIRRWRKEGRSAIWIGHRIGKTRKEVWHIFRRMAMVADPEMAGRRRLATRAWRAKTKAKEPQD